MPGLVQGRKGAEVINTTTRKPNRCKHCKERMPVEKAHHVIHDECIDPWRIANAEKFAIQAARKKVLAEKVDRALTMERRERLKRIPDRIKEAQKVFNAWVRTRDQHQTCISCGKPPGDMTQLHAGRDAGHYRSTGSASHLRFHEDNCHAQCVKCNQWGAGMAVDYRIRLLERIGLDRVEALEADNAVNKWTHEELKAIKSKYAAKLKELKARAE
ncbi:MAG: ninG protein [Comamonadaceae bacterium]|nr:MAG: ninG protein [Comamonadaceae bacterium]